MRIGAREALRRGAFFLLFVLGTFGYFLTNRLGVLQVLPARIVTWPLDALVPLVPAFVVPYLLFLPYVAGTALVLFLDPSDRYYRFVWTVFAGMAAATAVFFLYPTAMDRPSLSGGDAFTSLLRLVYAADGPFDCLPSTHVFYSAVSAWHLLRLRPRARALQAASLAFVLLVWASTVLVKQHHLPDVPAGLALAAAAVLAFEIPKEVRPWRRST